MAKKGTTPEAPTKKVSLTDAANRVVGELKPGDKTTLGELTKKAEAMVTASGGKVSTDSARSAVKWALTAAETFGMVKLVKPTDIQVERVQ